MSQANPEPIYLADYRPPDFLVERVGLDVALASTDTRVASRLSLRPNPASPGRAPLLLDGEGLELESIALNGRTLEPSEFEKTADGLMLPGPFDGAFELDIVSHINPEANKALSGLYRSRSIYCTQCEPEGFRRITYFPDRPDVLAVYTVRIEGEKDEAPVLLANGNPLESGPVAGTTRHFARWHDPHPKPSYLFALVGGDLALVCDRFTTRSGRAVDLRIYVEPGKEDRCGWAMESLKRCMSWDEERYGLEYDLDVFMIVAVSDFNMGAMENKGLNIFNDKLILARPDTATDADYAAIEAVIAHEYFHNWTGNRVTCRDWFQLCLKEGLTVFRDQEFTGDVRSAGVKRIADTRALKAHQFSEDAGPLAHPVRPSSYIEINNFYTATVYEKGAELCRMLQTRFGRDGFRSGLDLYFARHDGEAATVEDFIAAMGEANAVDLTSFLAWYGQAGTPELAWSMSYDTGAKTATLELEQKTPNTPGQSDKAPLPMPIRIGLLGPNGDDLPLIDDAGAPLANDQIELTRSAQTFSFSGVPAAPVVSLLRGFSAPVKIVTPRDERELAFLMANDSDAFNRWQAGQAYANTVMIDMVAAIRSGAAPRTGAAFAEALAATLSDDTLEPAYRAEFLQLPSEADIAREIGEDIDPDAIHAARQRMRQRVGEDLYRHLASLYDGLLDDAAYSPDATSAGKRSLRNAALSLLCASARPGEIARAKQHYDDARNMTDKIAALSILTHSEDAARQAAFDTFYKDWQDDHLVVDKWYALQALSSLPGTLDRVRGLVKHAQFSYQTPNKVRALIGTFAAANPTGFHSADGAGYAFIADAVLELDRFNPQMAARLAGAFKTWRQLEPGRRAQAEAELERIANSPDLSRDCFEIVSKTLA